MEMGGEFSITYTVEAESEEQAEELANELLDKELYITDLSLSAAWISNIEDKGDQS